LPKRKIPVEIANGFVPLAEKARDHVASFARSRRQLARVPGFTLIELLVVVAIIAILAAMLLPTLQRAKVRSKQAACTNNMKQFHVALTCFADDNDMRLPLYMWYLPEGFYYGVPSLAGQGLKFGRHDAGQVCTPETARREVTAAEVAALREVIDRYMPGTSGEMLGTLTCLYTNTPDIDFIVDHHPEHDQVIIACGFCGHGFKFASVMGEVLADLTLAGATPHPIEFLSLKRFSGVSLK